MRGIRVWARLLGLARAVVEDVFLDGEVVVVCVRPRARERGRCPLCRRRCAGYEAGRPKLWRLEARTSKSQADWERFLGTY
ncbi:MAG: hypothetical protein LC777_18515 [Actinobacteria bacterium]|nr:hypothetical protein [Actinomycetota bacterium]